MCRAKFSQLISIEQEIYCIEESQGRSLVDQPDLFSAYEKDYCQNKPTPSVSAAGLWCAKQAFIKAAIHLRLEKFNYLDLEIRHYPSGKPRVKLYGHLARQFKEQNIDLDVAIAHTKTLAVASVLLWQALPHNEMV
ncbi:4'-phosphopantetheinyl transferase superfamily protein [Pleurocapsales cyanobacterium LEGE 10410]|nr:4'-phosphopantetheinyl transferase superfamily protein [Pleurocapsales cyanobacterium LEGE 10410]